MALTLAIAGSVPRIQWLISPHRWLYPFAIFIVLVALPSFGTTTVALLQDTSLAFTIGIVDVVGKARAIGAVTYHTLEGYVGAAILFITLSIILERVFDVLEKRMNFTEAKKSSFQLPRLLLIKNKEVQIKKVQKIETNLKEELL